jgi:hypothetical protein
MKEQLSEGLVRDLRDFISSFASSSAKRRLLSLLETKNGRRRILDELDHVNWLDSQSAWLVPSNRQTIGELERLLVERGAPEMCRVISTDPALNDRTLHLREALIDIVGGGRGAVVTCVSGRLAYYESEEPQERYICARQVIGSK